MRKYVLCLAIAITVLSCKTTAYDSTAATMTTSGDQRSALSTAMRKLWSDHVVYTRLYIIAAVNGTDDAQPTAAVC